MIRLAKPGDALELTEIAHRSKRYWGYSDQQIEKWSEGLTVTPKFIENNMVYFLEELGNKNSFYALVRISRDELELEHFWVAPKYVGTGKGRVLFADIKQKMISVGVKKLRIVSDPNAQGFYERMGAIYQRDYFSPESGRHLPLLEFTIA